MKLHFCAPYPSRVNTRIGYNYTWAVMGDKLPWTTLLECVSYSLDGCIIVKPITGSLILSSKSRIFSQGCGKLNHHWPVLFMAEFHQPLESLNGAGYLRRVFEELPRFCWFGSDSGSGLLVNTGFVWSWRVQIHCSNHSFWCSFRIPKCWHVHQQVGVAESSWITWSADEAALLYVSLIVGGKLSVQVHVVRVCLLLKLHKKHFYGTTEVFSMV